MKKPEKGALQKAFQKTRKLVLLGAVPLMLGGCVTTGAYQGGGFFGQPGIYNQNTSYQVSYTPTRQPWGNDPNYREEVRYGQVTANLTIQQLQAKYRSDVASCNSRFSNFLARHEDLNEWARRDGMTFNERLQSGARLNQASASFNACKVYAEANFREGVLAQQQRFNNWVHRLDNKYAPRYGR